MSSVDEEFTGQSSQGHDGQESAVDLNDVNDMPDMSEMQRLLEEQEAQFKSIKRGDVVEGQIVRMDQDEILVDIGLKSEGVLSTKELPNQGYGSLAELKMGDNVLVYVMQPETPEGHAIVSIKRARLERQWRVAQEQYERGDLLEAEVIDHNKGGLIVNLEGIRGFVPISQILNLKREDTADNQETQNKLQSMVGRKLQLKIIEINRNRNRLILSERLAVQEWRAKRREELLNELQVGEVRKGIVSNLSNFGAFVDLGGADGLVHISQLAWSRVNHPSEVLKVGQEVEVQVLSVDKEKKKIALSIKRAEVDPWTTVEARYQVGQLVHGTITKIAPFGAFARIEDGVEGLIHLSELPAGQQDPKAVLKEGQDVTVRILRIDAERRRLGLSIRQVDEIAPAAEEAPQATEHEATASHPSAEAPAEGAADVSAPSQPEQPAGRPEQPSRGRPRPQPEEAPMTAMAAAFQAAHAANQDRPQPEATASTPTATAPVEAPAETPPAPAPAEAAPAPVEAPAQDTAEAVSAPVEAPAAATPAEAAPAEVAPTPPEAAATPPAETPAETPAEAAEAPVEAAPTPAPDVPEAEQTAAANGAADATTAAQAVEAPVTGPAAKTKRSAPAETPAAEGETSAPTEA